MAVLRLVLGDQLSDRLTALEGLDPAADTVLMAEVRDEATYVRHHKQKIALVFAAMRNHAERLRARGVRVRYVAGYDLPGDSPNVNPLPSSMVAAIKLVVGNYYQNREAAALLARGETLADLPLGVAAPLDPYRLDFGIA